jgi:predicted nucleic-acid-binding protein
MGRTRFLRSLDTNILLRIIMHDEPRQFEEAVSALASPVFIPATVLLETAWVLSHSYGIDRQSLAKALLGILDAPTVTVDEEPAMRWALARYSTVKSDIADLFHIAQSKRTEKFATFDRKLSGQAGSASPVPIETLGI